MQSNIERQVMASVGVIHTARRMFSRTALKVYTLVASVYTLGILVWVSRVGENLAQVMNGGVLAVGDYVLYAVTHTSVAVQVVLVVTMLAFISLAADLVLNFAPQRHIAY